MLVWSGASIILSAGILTLNEKHLRAFVIAMHCYHLSLSFCYTFAYEFLLSLNLLSSTHTPTCRHTTLTDCQHSTPWRETVAMAMNFPNRLSLMYIYRAHDIAYSHWRKGRFWLDLEKKQGFRDPFQLLVPKWECKWAHYAHAASYGCKAPWSTDRRKFVLLRSQLS